MAEQSPPDFIEANDEVFEDEVGPLALAGVIGV
jgi:hypothetical protein